VRSRAAGAVPRPHLQAAAGVRPRQGPRGARSGAQRIGSHHQSLLGVQGARSTTRAAADPARAPAAPATPAARGRTGNSVTGSRTVACAGAVTRRTCPRGSKPAGSAGAYSMASGRAKALANTKAAACGRPRKAAPRGGEVHRDRHAPHEPAPRAPAPATTGPPGCATDRQGQAHSTRSRRSP